MFPPLPELRASSSEARALALALRPTKRPSSLPVFPLLTSKIVEPGFSPPSPRLCGRCTWLSW
jgi:hypothetical protein